VISSFAPEYTCSCSSFFVHWYRQSDLRCFWTKTHSQTLVMKWNWFWN